MKQPKPQGDERRNGAIARLREERVEERFSQEELAAEIAISRMALANYEQGVSKLPFIVGMAVCRRLDLNPRWLATGEGEKRPYITPGELGISEEDLRLPPRLVDFVAGYDKVLAKPLENWEQSHSKGEWARRMIEGGPAALARRLSRDELEQTVITSICSMFAAREYQKATHLENVIIFATELKVRLDIKNRKPAKTSKS